MAHFAATNWTFLNSSGAILGLIGVNSLRRNKNLRKGLMIVLQSVPSDIKLENHARFFTIGESPITLWGNLCIANDLFEGNGDSMCSKCERFFLIKSTNALISMFRIFRT